MKPHFLQIPGIVVRVDNVMYVPGLETPADKPYAFVYFITIENATTEAIEVRGRKWIVQEQGGECTVVEGEGVIGELPCLEPGEQFSYNSYHVIAEEAEAKGTLFGRTAGGELFSARMPAFKMEVPQTL